MIIRTRSVRVAKSWLSSVSRRGLSTTSRNAAGEVLQQQQGGEVDTTEVVGPYGTQASFNKLSEQLLEQGADDANVDEVASADSLVRKYAARSPAKYRLRTVSTDSDRGLNEYASAHNMLERNTSPSNGNQAGALPPWPMNTRFAHANFPELATFIRGAGSLSSTRYHSENVRRNAETQFLDPIYLRDMCTCERCVEPSSGQKYFSTTDIPMDITVAGREQISEGRFAFTWNNDVPGYPPDHTTLVSLDDLNYHLFVKEERRSRTLRSWTANVLRERLLEMDYEQYINDLGSYKQVLTSLRDQGMVFIKNVPESEQSVVDIAERIGPLRNTFYGSTWDVKSVPRAENVAYTSRHLGFHMDLLYMQNPPKLQFLHCLRSSAKGGASLFSDSFQAIHEMVKNKDNSWSQLENVQTVFHYNRNGRHYMQSRPFVEFSRSLPQIKDAASLAPFIDNVNWSPPFQGPHTASEVLQRKSRLSAWLAVAKSFNDRIESETNVYERKMSPGECVIFDNRRVLHARTAFDPGDYGKERWLKGCYVDGDAWESELNAHEI
ncbi:hypothetical protein CAC42_3586 [Sphaceloma murrayae]|uniref:TauD/TfdA-like domain-containing protein n=1 Tax=Sphaceloma murrayae TaxID=2082308 RepID=A0A2K1QSX1_9PEZI|nr:hypothetical protein CAC42_3586 [Sphaceloma murrayae]